MADGDKTAGGVGMGMIIGLLIVILIVAVGGYFIFAGGHVNPGSTVSGSVTVK